MQHIKEAEEYVLRLNEAKTEGVQENSKSWWGEAEVKSVRKAESGENEGVHGRERAAGIERQLWGPEKYISESRDTYVRVMLLWRYVG